MTLVTNPKVREYNPRPSGDTCLASPLLLPQLELENYDRRPETTSWEQNLSGIGIGTT